MRPALVLSLCLAACVRHVPAPSTSGFPERVRAELATPAPLDRTGLEDARGRHFLFVGGFLHEGIPGYFADNRAVVDEELGATSSAIYPPSGGDLEADAELLFAEISRLTDEQQRPIVLIGHSKGGAGAVLCVLRHPELVSGGRVSHVVSIQGALHGSPVADGLVRSLPVPLLHDAFRGLTALTRQRADAAFKRAPMRPELAGWYRERVRYIRSFETMGQVSHELGLSHAFLATHGSGRNDGLLLEEDQLLEGVGRDLGVLRGDHAAFTVSSPLSNGTSDSRKAFTRALVKELFLSP